MAKYYGILGQLTPAAAAPGVLYTAPAGRYAVISTLKVCMFDAGGDVFSVWIVKAGDTASTNNIAFFELPVSYGNNTMNDTSGITLAPGESIVVESANGFTCFQISGKEDDIDQ